MNLNERQTEIIEFIKSRESVSFVELSDKFQDWWKGDYEYTRDGYNIVFWAGMSAEACDAMIELVAARRIELVPTTPLVYLCDGGGLTYPLVKSARKYKKPHWLPVVVNTLT